MYLLTTDFRPSTNTFIHKYRQKLSDISIAVKMLPILSIYLTKWYGIYLNNNIMNSMYGGQELNTLQLQKTHASRKSTGKWIWPQVLQMLTTQPNKEMYLQRVFVWLHWVFAVHFFTCLCREHLQRVLSSDEVVFWICRCFFYLQRVGLSRPPYAYILIPRTKVWTWLTTFMGVSGN